MSPTGISEFGLCWSVEYLCMLNPVLRVLFSKTDMIFEFIRILYIRMKRENLNKLAELKRLLCFFNRLNIHYF